MDTPTSTIKSPIRLSPYAVGAALFWTLMIGISFGVQIQEKWKTILRIGEYQAEAAYKKDIIYRRWATAHGGVYVPVTKETLPNPYLAHIPERDITTPSGRKLTLINPAYMTRQVHELGARDYGMKGHITSLNPIRPQNNPDPWEIQALKRFEKGEHSVLEINPINGEPHLRFMHVMVTEKKCLKCHQAQGYKVGDIRGGIGESQPMKMLIDVFLRDRWITLVTHLVLWLIGILFIATGFILLSRRITLQAQLSDALEQAQRAAAEEAEKLTVILRSIAEGVVTTDLQGRIQLMNSAAAQMCRTTNEAYSQKPIQSLFPMEEKPHSPLFPILLERLQTTGLLSELQGEFQHVMENHTSYYDVSAAPLKDRASKLIGAVFVIRDITERHIMQVALHNQDKLESLSLLAGGIAHDFNNLLGAIFGYLELIRYSADNPTRVREYADQATQAFERARALTSQLLTFAKNENPNRQPTDMAELVQKTVQFMLSGSNVKVAMAFAADLHTCDVDQNQMGQVIDNIVINAMQAMTDGGTLKVCLENADKAALPAQLSSAGDYICLRISDTGIGIPQQDIDRIFNPFFTTKEKGNGLGLATVYSIVKQHNGTVTVHSIPGTGTTFSIYLPASAQPPAVQDSPAPPPADKHYSGIAMVIDDEAFLLDISATILRQFGLTVYTAVDAAAAVSTLKTLLEAGEKVDLVLLDLTIPGGPGGVEILKQLHQLDPSLQAVAVSGYSNDPVFANPSKYGFLKANSKPFLMKDIAHVLQLIHFAN